LYDKAAEQWRDKVVGGSLLALSSGVIMTALETSRTSNELRGYVISFGAACLAGVGIAGYGFGQLSMTSQELTAREQNEQVRD